MLYELLIEAFYMSKLIFMFRFTHQLFCQIVFFSFVSAHQHVKMHTMRLAFCRTQHKHKHTHEEIANDPNDRHTHSFVVVFSLLHMRAHHVRTHQTILHAFYCVWFKFMLLSVVLDKISIWKRDRIVLLFSVDKYLASKLIGFHRRSATYEDSIVAFSFMHILRVWKDLQTEKEISEKSTPDNISI